MCTYSNTQAEDQFDWLRNAGNTPSLQTGPKVDHTLGTGLGKYICDSYLCLRSFLSFALRILTAHNLWRH